MVVRELLRHSGGVARESVLGICVVVRELLRCSGWFLGSC